MPCMVVKMPGGGSAIVKLARGRRPIKCVVCGNPGERLCDYPIHGNPGKTCDKGLCLNCSIRPDKETDLCPEHAEKAKRL